MNGEFSRGIERYANRWRCECCFWFRSYVIVNGLASRDDENLYMKDAVEDGILMEFWDVDLKGEKMRKYPIYAQVM